MELPNLQASHKICPQNVPQSPRPPRKKRFVSKSPANSPHKLGKIGPKRRRTIKISPKKVPTNSRPQESSCTALLPNTLKIEDFCEQDCEKASKTKLYNEVFAYFLQKLALQSSDPNTYLKPLREFLLPSPAQLKDSNPSSIFYMELIDENADSKETMAEVSELSYYRKVRSG